MDFSPTACDSGRVRTANLLAQQWMRAEQLVQSTYPGEIPVLAETRGLPWGTPITGSWLWERSMMRGNRWPPAHQITEVAQVMLMFTNAVEAVALGTSSDTALKLTGGSLVDPISLRTLLSCVGRAFDPDHEVDIAGLTEVDISVSTRDSTKWEEAVDMARCCKERFLRNSEHAPAILDRGRQIAEEIEREEGTLFFTDLVRSEVAEGHDEEEARLIVMEGITLSRAVITGETETSSYLASVQAARRKRHGLAGSVLVDDWIGGRRVAEFSPWVAVLSDGTVCNVGPDGSWAVKWHNQICVLGNLRTRFLPVTDAEMMKVRVCPKGRWWPTEMRDIGEFSMTTLASLGKLSSTIPDVMRGIQKDLDTAYAEGCDEFSDKAIDAACRALRTIQERHPIAWKVFVSRNVTVRTLLGLYEGASSPSEFASTMTERLVVGLSGCQLRITSDSGDKIITVRSTGAPSERGVSLIRDGREHTVGLSLTDLSDGLGVTEGQRRWVFAGLRMVGRRYDDVAGENCVNSLLNAAEYKRYAHLMPSIVKFAVGMLPYSDEFKHDRRTPYARKRAAIEAGIREQGSTEAYEHGAEDFDSGISLE